MADAKQTRVQTQISQFMGFIGENKNNIEETKSMIKATGISLHREEPKNPKDRQDMPRSAAVQGIRAEGVMEGKLKSWN